MKKHSLVLASASPRRLELLRQIGVIPDQVTPADIDENPLKNELPQAYAKRIAAEKTAKVADLHPGSFILAADTVVACGRRILPKAETAEDARKCLALLSGRRHRVHTAVSIIDPAGRARHKVQTSVVRMTRLSDGDIEEYIAGGEWKGKAGGYAIQGHAATLIAFVSGSYSCIVGLPLHETWSMLKGLGYERS